MDNEQYKISLGVELNTGDLQEQINEAGRKAKPIELDVELKSVNDDIKDIKTQLNSLGKKGGLSINTDGIEKSLTNVSKLIENISRSIGTLNTKKGTSIVTTINNINKALQSATKQFEQLNKSLNVLGGKDLNLNFNLKAGNTNPVKLMTDYGRAVRENALPALEQQSAYLKAMLGDTQQAEKAINNYFSKYHGGFQGISKKNELIDRMSGISAEGTKVSLSEQMSAYKQFIGYLREIASMKGINLDGFDAKFSKSADEIVKETVEIQSGAKQAKEEVQELGQVFKNAFGSGNNLNVEGVSEQLESIVRDLGEIRKALVGLPEEEVEGLTQTFNRLSTALDDFVKNVGSIKPTLDKTLSGVDADATADTGKQIEKHIEQKKTEAQQAQETANTVVQAEEKIQQAKKETANVIKQTDAASQSPIDGTFDFDNLDGKIDGLRDALRGLNIENTSITSITRDLEQLNTTAKNATVTFKNGQLVKFDVKGVQETEDGIQRIVTLTKTFNKSTESFDTKISFSEPLDKAAEAAEKINNKLKLSKDGISDFDKEIASVETKFSKLSNQSVELRKKIESLKTEFGKIKVASDSGDTEALIEANNRYEALLKELNNELDINAQKQRQAAAEQKATKQVQAELNKTIDNLAAQQKKIGDLKAEIKKLENIGGRSSEIDFLKKQLEELEATYNRLKATFDDDVAMSGVESLVDTSKIDEEVEKTEARLEHLERQYEDTRANLAKDIEIDLKAGKFTSQVEKISSGVEKIRGEASELRTKLGLLKTAEDALNKAFKSGSIEEIIAAYDNYVIALKNAEIQLERNQRAEQKAKEEQKLENDSKLFQNNIEAWLSKNSAAAKKFGGRLRQMQVEAQNCDRVKLDNLEAEFKQIDRAAEASGLKMQKFGDRLKTQLSKYGSYFSIASVFMYVEQGLKDMFEQVKAIDSAMTELKKVTDETDESYNRFLRNAASRAKEIGTTIDGLVSSTADFARLGYGFEDAQGLAEVANIYAVVGDEIDGVEQATESLISTMAAFKDSANDMSNSDFAMSIVDKFNEIGNNFAISSGGIGDALERSASSLDAANNTIDESIALITAANTVVQDPEAVGTAFKTISMRIRGAKSELEDAGLETDGMVESTAKLRSEILALSGVDIMENANEFKSTYKIMDELAAKWQDLTDIQQATITELIAGKRQGNIVSSLMANFDTAREALEVSANSAGSAMEEHAKWSESLEARLLKLKASWQSLSQSFMSSDFLKATLDIVISLVDGVTKLIDAFGALGTIGFGTGIFNIVKHLKDFVNLRIFASLPSELKSVGMGFRALGYDLKKFIKTPAGIASAIGLVTAAVGLLVNAYKKAKEEQSRIRQEAIQASNEFLDAAGSFEQAYIKYSDRTNLTAEEESELKTAIQGTVDALGDKSSALQGLVNNSNDYLASLEAITKAELKAANSAAKEKRTAAEKELKSVVEPNIAQFLDGDSSSVNVVIERRNMSSDGEDASEAEKIAREAAGEYYQLLDANRGSKYYGFELPSNASVEDIVDYYYSLVEAKNRLLEKDLGETDTFDSIDKAIDKMSESVSVYESGIYDAVKAQYQLSKGIPKATEEYVAMRESILRSDDISGLSLDTKMSILNSLDSEYGQLFDLKSAEVQARKFIGIIKGYGDGTKDGVNEIGTVETFLNMRTAVNNNDCTVGEYLSELDNITSMSEKFSKEEREQFNLAFGLDTDSIKNQYADVYNYIYRNYLDKINTAGYSGFNAYLYKDSEINRIQSLLGGLSSTELKAVASIKAEIDWENTSNDKILAQIKEEAALIEAMGYTIAIDVEAEGIEALNAALEESKSATGLTAESIELLKSRYEDLDGYDVATLFEETANGIRVNSTELNKLEKEYRDFNKQEADKNLKVLVGEYNDLTKEIKGCSDASKRAELYAKRDEIQDQINDIATLASQFDGLTSAFNNWQKAQEAGQDRDMYESIISGREEIKDEMSRGWLDDATVEYLELLTGKELSTAGIDAQIAAYKKLDDTIGKSGYSIWDFFTEDEDGNATSDGVFNFFDTVRSVAGETAAWVDENGVYNFDFEGFEYEGETGDAAIAKMLGTSEELVQIILKAAEDAGFIVNIKGDYTDLANLKDEAEAANDKMKELGATTYTFNFDSTDINDLNEQIGEAETMLSNLKNKDGTLKVGVSQEDYRQAQDMIAALIHQKQSLDDSAILHVDTSQAKSDIENAILKLQEFKQYANTLELETAIGADTTQVTKDIQSTIEYINGLDTKIKAGLGLDTEDVQTAIGNVQANIKAGVAIKQEDIDTINAAISSISNDMMVKLGLDTTLIDNYKSTEQTAKGTVNWSNNIEKVTAWINQPHEASGTVKWDDDTTNLKTTYTGKGVIYWNPSEANGTANTNGTAFANGTTGGKAFKHGDWGIKGSGVALGGEVGTEILVRDGRWYTIGDNGAEFFKYRKGDIIFNHRQTEELFANGKVTSGGGRGKAFVDGTAFAFGSNALGLGRGAIKNALTKDGAVAKTKTKTETKSNKNGITVNNTTTIGSDSVNGSQRGTIKDAEKLDTSSSAKDKFEETFDWVEVAISRIERAIDQLDQKANNVYKSWSSRNSALSQEIGKVRKEIELQESAAQKYLQKANSIGLDKYYDENGNDYATLVRNGAISIEDFEGDDDEKLVEKIKDYQTWYEKALACEDAILELKETEASLYAQRVENVAAQYEGILGVIEHEKNIIEEYISQSEANAQLVSVDYYSALAKNERENLAKLKEEKAKMLSEMQVAMNSGTITEGSEAWYEMVSSIDEVTLAIAESNTQLIEYAQTIQQLSWEAFDLLQERISAVTEETEFLIDLMSNDKLFDDNGQLTNEGSATMGLHGVAYNTHMYQADQAANEAERLRKELAEDTYDTELEERYREMISLQQEHILAAEDEKEAIRDMVEEGIELELDALQERIDKYNEALDSQKDLYDYQKKVKEQTEEIASIEKQIASYGGNDSEEAKAKVQELKVSLEEAKADLEETEYDKYISDQQQLLDELYLEYEEILNIRLDNIDALISDMIAEINADATTISATLSEKAESVGYTLSDSMNTIWDTNSTKINSVITTYGENFTDAQTTTNNALSTINTNLQNMITQLNKIAKTNVKSASTSSASESEQADTPKKEETKTDTPKSNTSTIEVGGKVNAKGAQIYDYAGDKSGERQLYRNDPIYKVLKTDGNWLQVRWHKLSSGITGWFKKGDVKALATGARRINSNDMAWTQEKGQEYIVRPSDGAILTPVAKDDSVLNATASSNIWNMANNPREFIKDNLNLSAASAPNNSNVQSSYIQKIENVTFSLPNVHGYNELLTEMQKDKNFEKLILSMTIDRIAGKSALSKGKSIR